jgi:hypothetical protein
MSDVNPDTTVEIGHINITITDTDMWYDTEFTVPEVVFWLDVVKTMIMKRVMTQEEKQ